MKKPLTPAQIKKMLLESFADGDTWHEADALNITKHGALEIALFFYQEGYNEGYNRALSYQKP